MPGLTHDVVIVGGGPGGLTAGIYAGRERLSTLLVEKGLCGGMPGSTDLIENYPGFPDGVKGAELIQGFRKQAERFGVTIAEFEEVKAIEPFEADVKVRTDANAYSAHAVIVASGSIPKKLGVPGEEELLGKGVSYCATCDGPLYKNMDIAVIGCGNSGLQEGEALLNHVRSISFVEFLPHMMAEKILQERLQSHANTAFYLNHVLTSINGDSAVESVTMKDRATGEEKTLDVGGVFVYVGFLPNSAFLEGVVELDRAGYVITNERMETSLPGLYAAGDVRSKQVRQIAVACGEGAIAAIHAGGHIRQVT